MTTTDRTISEMLTEAQRTLAEAIEAQRRAVVRIAALEAQLAKLLTENVRLRAEQQTLVGLLPKGARA
jgi:hypothetical protein